MSDWLSRPRNCGATARGGRRSAAHAIWPASHRSPMNIHEHLPTPNPRATPTSTMPFSPFAPPDDTKEKDRQWQAFAKVGFRDSRPLWADYWQRFNTISIPLLDADAYFADTLAAAKVAQDREHLEALLSEKSKERRAELERVANKISLAVTFDMDLSSPTAAVDAADKIGRAGSLDSFLQLASGVVWGWGDEGQLGERRPRVERSPFNFTDAQEPSYSPHPQVSDAWDAADHGLDHWVTELEASPEPEQLPTPPPPRVSSTQAKDSDATAGVRHSAPEESYKPPAPSPETTDPAESAVSSQQSASSSFPTDATLPPATPTDAAPSPTTPPDLPSEREAGPPKPAPLGRRSSPQQEGDQEAGGGSSDARQSSPGGRPTPKRKRRLDELESSDPDDERACGKRSRSDVG